MSVIIGIFLGVIFFSAQGILCVYARNFLVKILPSAVAVLFFLSSLAIQGMFSGIILRVVSVITLLSTAGAWLVYYLTQKGK